jgi:hypothetical protein
MSKMVVEGRPAVGKILRSPADLSAMIKRPNVVTSVREFVQKRLDKRSLRAFQKSARGY